jgi:5'-3' exonuclease
MRFLVFDLNNLVKRAQHGKGTGQADSDEMFAAMVTHIALDTFQYLFHKFEQGHVVACVDHGSWRYAEYPEYKAHREYDEKDELVRAVMLDICEYLQKYTAVSLLKTKGAEADDLIARWCQLHRGPEYENIIISGDADFKQLVNDNTSLFSPNNDNLYTANGTLIGDGKKPTATDLTATRYGAEWKVVCDKDGNPLPFDPEYELFLKCIRGDTSDNIKTAWRNVRETKIRAAYADRGGLVWNNFINAHWGPEEQFSVREQYEFNRRLIDLRLIPAPVLDQMDECIGRELLKKRPPMVPHHFRKYCQRHKLIRLAERVNSFLSMLGTSYPLEQVEAHAVSNSGHAQRNPNTNDDAGGFFASAGN